MVARKTLKRRKNTIKRRTRGGEKVRMPAFIRRAHSHIYSGTYADGPYPVTISIVTKGIKIEGVKDLVDEHIEATNGGPTHDYKTVYTTYYQGKDGIPGAQSEKVGKKDYGRFTSKKTAMKNIFNQLLNMKMKAEKSRNKALTADSE